MITIPHIQGVISEENQEKIPTNFVAKHSVGSEWIYFETVEEYETYKSVHLPKQEETSEEYEQYKLDNFPQVNEPD